MSLSWRQTQVLNLIREHVDQRGYPPSLAELCAATGLRSRSSVLSVLRGLEAKGWIRREPGQPRTIQLLEPEASR